MREELASAKHQSQHFYLSLAIQSAWYAGSGCTIPATRKWACCTRNPIPVKERHWSWLEMRQTGAWQEQPWDVSKAELQGHDFPPSQACCPTHSKSAEHHSESKKWKAGPCHKAGEETSHNGWELRAHQPRPHRLALPITNTSPMDLENDCYSSSKIHLLHPSKL